MDRRLKTTLRTQPSSRTGLPRLPGTPFRRAVPTTPADRAGASVDFFPARAAFPKWQEGRHPHCHFRGLLRLHSRYGPPDRSVTYRDLCHGASALPVTRQSHPSATGPIDNYPCEILSEQPGIIDTRRNRHAVVNDNLTAKERWDLNLPACIWNEVDQVVLLHPVEHNGVNHNRSQVFHRVTHRNSRIQECFCREVRNAIDERNIGDIVFIVTGVIRYVIGDNALPRRDECTLKSAGPSNTTAAEECPKVSIARPRGLVSAASSGANSGGFVFSEVYR